MKKAVSILIMLALVALSCLVLVSPVKGNFKTIVAPDNYSTISVAINKATNGETILVRSGALPSPLISATLIIALVALFGVILSLYLRWRDRKSKK